MPTPVWQFYEGNGLEVIARPYMPNEDLSQIGVLPLDTPEQGDMILANPNTFENQRLMKRERFDKMFRSVRHNKKGY